MTRVLLVEDDANLCYIIKGGLKDMIGGYEVETASDGQEGFRKWRDWKPEVIVSDIEMPVMDGYEMVRLIREADTSTPILFTSGRVSPKDVVKGYEIGVNNYVKKPFLPEELDAHIKALLKLTQARKPECEETLFRIGRCYMFDAGRGLLLREGQPDRDLTAREAGLLRILCEGQGRVVRREVILSRLWDTEDDYFASRSLDVFVSRLRKMLSDDPDVHLRTVKGVGLMLEWKM